jgi:hypothetical protein
VTRQLGTLLHAQQGIVSRAQLLQHGVTPDAIRHRTSAGARWQVVLPGIYATFTGALMLTHRMHAALLWAGPGAMLTGATATRWYGLKYGPPDERVHVLVPMARHPASKGFVRIHRSVRPPQPAWYGGFPLVPVARAVVDTCRALRSLRDVRALLCESVQRGQATCDELRAVLDAGQSAGSALIRRALEDTVAGCRSAPECELRDVIGDSRHVTEPLWNLPLPDAPDIVPDACWPATRLIVEIDSIEWHGFGDAPERTERRRARLAALGWTVLPVSPRWLRADPAGVRQTLDDAYLAGLRRTTA